MAPIVGTLLKAVFGFFVDLFRAAYGEKSRDKANQRSGEYAVENDVVIAANERAKDAKKVSDNVNASSDDDIDRVLGGEDGK